MRHAAASSPASLARPSFSCPRSVAILRLVGYKHQGHRGIEIRGPEGGRHNVTTHRNRLRLALAAALAWTLAFPVAAKTIKIGIITTYSGPLAPPGITMDKGLSLYAKL